MTNLLTIKAPVDGFIEGEYEEVAVTIEPGTYVVDEVNDMDWNGFHWGLLGLLVPDEEQHENLVYVDCENLGFVICPVQHTLLPGVCPDCGGKGFLDVEDLARMDAEAAVHEARVEAEWKEWWKR